MNTPRRIGLLIFPRMTQLDATAPYEVFARMPDTETLLVAPTLDPVVSEFGLTISPTASIDTAPPLDVLCIPGGAGVSAILGDDRVLDYVAREGERARYVTSVCTGALVLGAAGLLRGYRATTHWLSLDLLTLVGATPVEERVVIDRNRITGGGVTAGIDFGLVMASLLCGESQAQHIQLLMEYDPAPPFMSGSPRTAPANITEAIRTQRASLQSRRRAEIETALDRRAKR